MQFYLLITKCIIIVIVIVMHVFLLLFDQLDNWSCKLWIHVNLWYFKLRGNINLCPLKCIMYVFIVMFDLYLCEVSSYWGKLNSWLEVWLCVLMFVAKNIFEYVDSFITSGMKLYAWKCSVSFVVFLIPHIWSNIIFCRNFVESECIYAAFTNSVFNITKESNIIR